MGRTAVLANPASSSSRRLSSLSPSASSVRGAKAASSRRPWWHSPARCGWKPRKKWAGVMLW